MFLPADATWSQVIHVICAWSAWEGSTHGRLSSAFMGIAIGSDGGNGHGRIPIFFPTHQIWQPLPGIGSPLGGYIPSGCRLRLSSFEEGDCESAEAPPPVSPQYEELLEGMTRTVAKLNISWPAEEYAEQQTRKTWWTLSASEAITSGTEPAVLPRSPHRGSRPAFLSPPLITTVMSGDWSSAVTEWCLG